MPEGGLSWSVALGFPLPPPPQLRATGDTSLTDTIRKHNVYVPGMYKADIGCLPRLQSSSSRSTPNTALVPADHASHNIASVVPVHGINSIQIPVLTRYLYEGTILLIINTYQGT